MHHMSIPLKSLHRVRIACWHVVSRALQFPCFFAAGCLKYLVCNTVPSMSISKKQLIPLYLVLGILHYMGVQDRYFIKVSVQYRNAICIYPKVIASN